MVIGLLVLSMRLESAAQTTASATRTGASSQDWPAFHGGGALTGEAPAIAAPPMRVRWTYRTDETELVGVLGSAAIAGTSVYVADSKGILHAIDLTSGKKIWTHTAKDGFETTPLVRDGRVLLGDLAGVFHAVSAVDGKPLWTFDSAATIHSSANAIGDRIYFGNDGAEIFCLNASDGKQIWKQQAGDRINSTPAIGASVFISGCDAQLRSLSPEDGSQKAAVELIALCPGAPAIIDGRIVLGTDGGNVQCFDVTTLKQQWIYSGIGNKAMVYSSPAVSRGIVVIGARDRNVHAIDLKDGSKKWMFPTRGDVDSSPVISDGRVYVGSNDKKFYVLDLQTGKELWSFTAGRSINGAAAIGQGVVIVADEGGSVYCLEPERK